MNTRRTPANGMIATLVVLLIMGIGASTIHAASLFIDDFVVPPEGQLVSVTGVGVGGPNTITGLAGVVGGARTMAVNVTSSDFNLGSRLIVTPAAPGTLSFSNDSGQNATGTVIWDANGAGLGGVDLTNGGTLGFLQGTILQSDQDIGFRIDITETAAAGGSTAFWSANLGPGTSLIHEALSSFTNAGDVDFTQVDKIMLTLTGPAAQDTTLNLLEVTSTPGEIPEPLTMTMLALGVGTLLQRRGRTQSRT